MSDDYKPTSQRTLIVNAVAAKVDALFGRGVGTVEKWLRNVERAPLRPMTSMYPSCIVRDGGQRRRAGQESEEMTDRLLTIEVVLYISGAWEDVDVDEEMTDRVSQLIYEIEGYCPPHGVRRMDYVSDDHPDVMWLSGGSNAIWVIRFECEYFAAKQVRDNR